MFTPCLKFVSRRAVSLLRSVKLSLDVATLNMKGLFFITILILLQKKSNTFISNKIVSNKIITNKRIILLLTL